MYDDYSESVLGASACKTATYLDVREDLRTDATKK